MSGNVSITSSGGIAYFALEPKPYSTAEGTKYGNSASALPNSFYNFGTANLVTYTLSAIEANKYQEYMFEVTAMNDNISLSIKSTMPLYWTRPIETKKDHIYQFSVVNGVIMWVEVSTV